MKSKSKKQIEKAENTVISSVQEEEDKVMLDATMIFGSSIIHFVMS